MKKNHLENFRQPKGHKEVIIRIILWKAHYHYCVYMLVGKVNAFMQHWGGYLGLTVQLEIISI